MFFFPKISKILILIIKIPFFQFFYYGVTPSWQLLLNQGILSSPSPRKLEDAQCIMFYSFLSACIPSLFFQLWYFTTLRLKSEFHRYLKQIPYHQYLSKYIRILASNSSSGLKLGWFEIGSRPESVEMPRSSATPILRAK